MTLSFLAIRIRIRIRITLVLTRVHITGAQGLRGLRLES